MHKDKNQPYQEGEKKKGGGEDYHGEYVKRNWRPMYYNLWGL